MAPTAMQTAEAANQRPPTALPSAQQSEDQSKASKIPLGLDDSAGPGPGSTSQQHLVRFPLLRGSNYEAHTFDYTRYVHGIFWQMLGWVGTLVAVTTARRSPTMCAPLPTLPAGRQRQPAGPAAKSGQG